MWSLCAAHVEITSTLSLVVEVSFFSKMSSTAPALPPAQAVTISEEEKSEWKETFTEVRLLIYTTLIYSAGLFSRPYSIYLYFVIT